MKFSSLLAGIALPVAMAACAEAPGSVLDLDELEHTKPTGSPFTQALSHEYAAFARAQAGQQEWAAQQHFAKKGLEAAHGIAVPPEDLAAWNIGDKQAAEDLAVSRSRLAGVLESHAPTRAPALTATAQVKFDCWLAELSEPRGDAGDACHKDFRAAMAALEALGHSAAQPGPPAGGPSPRP